MKYIYIWNIYIFFISLFLWIIILWTYFFCGIVFIFLQVESRNKILSYYPKDRVKQNTKFRYHLKVIIPRSSNPGWRSKPKHLRVQRKSSTVSFWSYATKSWATEWRSGWKWIVWSTGKYMYATKHCIDTQTITKRSAGTKGHRLGIRGRDKGKRGKGQGFGLGETRERGREGGASRRERTREKLHTLYNNAEHWETTHPLPKLTRRVSSS